MSKIGIVGWGVVGRAIGEGFRCAHKVLWHDPYKDGSTLLDKLVAKSEFIFICVPTPMFEDFLGIDLGVVDEVVGQIAPRVEGTDKIVIIKSTVLPGTTASFVKKYPKVNVASNPEFLIEKTAKEDFLNPDRTVVGAQRDIALRVKKIYEAFLPEDHKYFLTDPTTAELVKYASNVTLASRIGVANEIYQIAQALGVDYGVVRKMVGADWRIGTAMTQVPGPDGDFGFGGKCLPKDMVAFLELEKRLGVDMSVIRAIWEKNLKVRNVRDWERIPGAVSKKW